MEESSLVYSGPPTKRFVVWACEMTVTIPNSEKNSAALHWTSIKN